MLSVFLQKKTPDSSGGERNILASACKLQDEFIFPNSNIQEGAGVHAKRCEARDGTRDVAAACKHNCFHHSVAQCQSLAVLPGRELGCNGQSDMPPSI